VSTALLFIATIALNEGKSVHSEKNPWIQVALNNSNDTEIVIQHNSLNKEGPSYSLRIDGNGNVEYNGLSNVKTLGKYFDKLSSEDLNRIIQGFKESYFFYLNENYGSSTEPNSQQQDEVSISLRLGDKSKIVKYTQGSTVSLSLKMLVEEIEKITNATQLSGKNK
jgi:hypothetical protein